MILIPKPSSIRLKEDCFVINNLTKIVLDINCKTEDLYTAQKLQSIVTDYTGIRPSINKAIATACKENTIFLKIAHGSKEGYSLIINDSLIEIIGEDSAGLFYAVQTLSQLIKLNKLQLPCCEIKDEPQFKYRGFYHDVTRGKVPTLDTMKELADRAAAYKLNQLQLYIEHTFAFEDMSEIWIGADPLTAEEILILDEYCKKLHIELVPSLSTFGHFYHILTSNSFGHLCELENSIGTPYSWIDRMMHHTLDVSNDESIILVEKMINEFLPLFSSNKFNICCDETFDLGKGKNKELADKVGAGTLYVDFLIKVMDIVRKHDKEISFWGDIILKHPELLDRIPKDVVCLNWNYCKTPNEEDTKTIAASGIPQYVCPGVAGWNTLMNDMDEAYGNIVNMATYGARYGAVGLLNTDWGDYGHINLFANSMPGMILGAACSWNVNEIDRPEDFDRKLSILEYGDESGKLIGLLRDLARQQGNIYHAIVWWHEGRTVPQINSEKRMQECLKVDGKLINERYNKALQFEKELQLIIPKVSPDHRQDMNEFCVSARGIALLNAVLIAIKKVDLKQAELEFIIEPKTLATKLEKWFYDYSIAWRTRNKESELYRIRDLIIYICSFLRKI